MKRFVSKTLFSIRPICKNILSLEPNTQIVAETNKFRSATRSCWTQNGGVLNSAFRAGWQSFSTDTAKNDDPDASKKTEETETEVQDDDVEAMISEVPSVEEIQIETLTQRNREYKALIDEKKNTIGELSSQLDKEKKKVLLALAEAENLRTRFARESAQIKKFAVQGLVRDLLACIDNLDRAVESVPIDLQDQIKSGMMKSEQLLNTTEGLLSGVRMTQNEFKSVLSSQGVERYDPLDEPFDPNRHMARFELEDPSKEPGTVGVVTLCGYSMHDRIIRPAEVGVVKKREETEESKIEQEKEASS